MSGVRVAFHVLTWPFRWLTTGGGGHYRYIPFWDPVRVLVCASVAVAAVAWLADNNLNPDLKAKVVPGTVTQAVTATNVLLAALLLLIVSLFLPSLGAAAGVAVGAMQVALTAGPEYVAVFLATTAVLYLVAVLIKAARPVLVFVLLVLLILLTQAVEAPPI